MSELSSLSIRYASKDGDATFGWSSRGVDTVDPYRLCILAAGSEEVITARGESFVEAVHAIVLLFFNGAASADLNIPPNCPYEFYEPGRVAPTYHGVLRPTERAE